MSARQILIAPPFVNTVRVKLLSFRWKVRHKFERGKFGSILASGLRLPHYSASSR